MNRIDKKFIELNANGKKAFVAFITAGDPDLRVTEELVLSLTRCGVDIVELGVPFSDPMADGPTIQRASERALKNKVSLEGILRLVKRLRTNTQIPLALMSYYNPIFKYGINRFVKDAVKDGVDGVIVPDLPPEEAKDLLNISRKLDFATIFLLSPTSTEERIKLIAKESTGFIYYVSLTGVTGAREELPEEELFFMIREIKKYTAKPICVGFGISRSGQAKRLCRISDGVIVGSAIVRMIEGNLGKGYLVGRVEKFVKGIAGAIHGG